MHQTLNRMREKRSNDEGFTLIELLVVVVIIGVLVAIAVPVYLNYRKGAADKSAQSDVRAAVSTLEQFYTDNGNVYPASTTGMTCASKTAAFQLTLAGGCTAGTAGAPGWVVLSDKTTMTYVLVSATTYKICATNTGGSDGTTAGVTKVYLYDSSVGGSVKVPATPVAIATCV